MLLQFPDLKRPVFGESAKCSGGSQMIGLESEFEFYEANKPSQSLHFRMLPSNVITSFFLENFENILPNSITTSCHFTKFPSNVFSQETHFL